MGVTVTLTNKNEAIGELIDYTVIEDATPLTVGDTSGSVGQLNVAARAKTTGPIFKRSGTVVGDSILLSDTRSIDGTSFKGRGEIQGQITQGGLPGERINITAETLLARLNTERTAKPFFGSYVPPQTTAAVRTNLYTNPSRETNLTGVTMNLGNGGAATLSRPTDGGYDGAAYARVAWTASNTGQDGGSYDTVTDLSPGRSYTFSGYYRAVRAGTVDPSIVIQRVRMIVRFYNSSNAVVGTDTVTEATLRQNEWTRIVTTATMPAGASYARMYVVSTPGAGYATWKAGDAFDSDAILVEQGVEGVYFSGSSQATDVLDPLTNIRVVTSYSWTGTANASQSVSRAETTNPGYGYDATQGNYFRYLCELVDLYAVSVDPEFENRPVAYPGWTGNVWKFMKDFAAANRAEVALVGGVVTLRKPRTIDVPIESVAGPTMNVNSALASQFVEVNNYNSRWGTDEPVAKVDTVVQVDRNGYVETRVTVPHFLTKVNNPVAVATFNPEYDAGQGQYTVLDSQGLVVDPTWWRSNGGRVETVMEYDSFNEIIIRIYGARVDSNGYIGPYRLGRIVGNEEVSSSLQVTGTGVFVNKEVVRIRTGVSSEQTSTITDAVIDNVFLSNANLAYTRGLDAACAAAGPVVTLTGTIGFAYAEGAQEFGMVAGGRIRFGGNVFRITNVRITSGGIQFTGLADMVFSDIIDLYSYTFADFNTTYPGITFATFDTLMAGKTFAQFNTQFGNPDFNRFNEIYAGATFNDHATYPYIGEVINEPATTA